MEGPPEHQTDVTEALAHGTTTINFLEGPTPKALSQVRYRIQDLVKCTIIRVNSNK